MRYLIGLFFLIPFTSSFSQSVNAPLNEDNYHWIDRYEIQSGRLSEDFHSSWRAYQRENIASFMEKVRRSNDLSKVDRYNVNYLINDNWEWADSAYNESKKPILKHFYKVKSDLYHVDEPDFDLHVNPVLHLGGGMETAAEQNTFINTRGVEVRGMVDKKVSFYSFIGENQVIFPEYVRDGIAENIVVPQEGFWKDFKSNGVDFFTARGYLSFNATKHINLQFGHDRFKVGNGFRSMILSDNTPAYLFLKMNTKVWRINYTNLYTQLTADVFGNAGGLTGNDRYPSKYMSMHHLSINISKKLNIGIFESVVYGVDSTGVSADFDIQYLNPIIFYRSLEQQNGSPDNALLGLDFKWLALKGISIYGQLVLDEFLLENIKEGEGWWANKYGVQIGGEYINAFGIKNLDLQLEANLSRPYTYSHSSPYGSYSHYEQSLAHPLGANFNEIVGIMRFQPIPRLNIKAKLIKAEYGTDGVDENWGGDILKNNVTRQMNFNNQIGQGVSNDLLYGNLSFSYMLRHNLFIDLSHTYRKLDSEDAANDATTNYTSGAIRWNIPQRLNEF
ncbi:hypothetical protein E1176_18435 [Fulvivirga sp. RKSG066]|uniref:hypothetical protein n=1 Tax=Fulvivirga aurantia TaxID=2529383 RepID=UPI0012BC3274|nr:hypothetical protein [Fulvivirga aurantia]MTI23015.1 hypothetical protein [Fulvivirga aurantia]